MKKAVWIFILILGLSVIVSLYSLDKNGVIDIDMKMFGKEDTVEVVPALNVNVSKGLVAYWSFDENQGSITQSDVGDFTGDIVGTEWGAEGKSKGSFYFDGYRDKIEFDSTLDSVEFTFAAWIYSDNKNRNINAIMSNRESSCAKNDRHYGYTFFLNSLNKDDRTLHVVYGNSSNGCSEVVTSDGVVSKDEWVFVSFTADKELIKIYVNEKFVGSGPNTREESLLAVKNMKLGLYDSVLEFNGFIDEVRIYDRALNHEEIKELYNSV